MQAWVVVMECRRWDQLCLVGVRLRLVGGRQCRGGDPLHHSTACGRHRRTCFSAVAVVVVEVVVVVRGVGVVAAATEETEKHPS
jgi:hypothetical protein